MGYHLSAAIAALSPDDLALRKAYHANAYEIDEAKSMIAEGRRRLRAAEKLAPSLWQTYHDSPGFRITQEAYAKDQSLSQAVAPGGVSSPVTHAA